MIRLSRLEAINFVEAIKKFAFLYIQTLIYYCRPLGEGVCVREGEGVCEREGEGVREREGEVVCEREGEGVCV